MAPTPPKKLSRTSRSSKQPNKIIAFTIDVDQLEYGPSNSVLLHVNTNTIKYTYSKISGVLNLDKIKIIPQNTKQTRTLIFPEPHLDYTHNINVNINLDTNIVKVDTYRYNIDENNILHLLRSGGKTRKTKKSKRSKRKSHKIR